MLEHVGSVLGHVDNVLVPAPTRSQHATIRVGHVGQQNYSLTFAPLWTTVSVSWIPHVAQLADVNARHPGHHESHRFYKCFLVSRMSPDSWVGGLGTQNIAKSIGFTRYSWFLRSDQAIAEGHGKLGNARCPRSVREVSARWPSGGRGATSGRGATWRPRGGHALVSSVSPAVARQCIPKKRLRRKLNNVIPETIPLYC